MQQANFDFVKNVELRKNIIDSIPFLSYLWLLASANKEGNTQEMFRTFILYNASIIEALLLDYCQTHGIIFTKVEYSNDCELSASYQLHIDGNKYQKGKIVISTRHEIEKRGRDITFVDMIEKLKGFLDKELVNDIRELNDIRNTFHLSKERKKAITKKDAEKASTTLLELSQKLIADLFG